jgi:hypothetical protein
MSCVAVSLPMTLSQVVLIVQGRADDALGRGLAQAFGGRSPVTNTARGTLVNYRVHDFDEVTYERERWS